MITLKNDQGAAVQFTGRLLAEVSTLTDSQKVSNRMYWTEHKLFLTDGGCYVLQTLGRKKGNPEEYRSKVNAIAPRTPDEVCAEVTRLITEPIQGRGKWMAALLLDRAGLLRPVTID